MRAFGVFAVCWLGACAQGGTSLLVEIDGPETTLSLAVTVTVDGTSVVKTIATNTPSTKLPARLVVELADVKKDVSIDLVGTIAGGATLESHKVAKSEPHRQVTVAMSLMSPGADLGGDGVMDLAGADVAGADLAAPPDLTASPPDLAPDLTKPTLAARLINNAYYCTNGVNTYASAGMTHDAFQLSTSGVVNGDLVLVIGNVDNGSNSVWPVPIFSGFTELAQQYFGSDGQTYVLSWKIANNEPATYTATYGSGAGSSCATISLIAVSGANPAAPINVFINEYNAASPQDPVIAASSGVTTTVANTLLIYAAGSDWLSQTGSSTYVLPTGFTQLTAFGDHGNSQWEWTSQMIGYKPQPAIGATGPISGTMDSTINGMPWSAVIAVAPAP